MKELFVSRATRSNVSAISLIFNNYSPKAKNIGEYLPRLRLGKYSPIFTSPSANNCFSIILELNNREIGNQNIFISGST